MNSIYVLLIVTNVYSGFSAHTQEFNSLENCEKAKNFYSQYTRKVECVKK